MSLKIISAIGIAAAIAISFNTSYIPASAEPSDTSQDKSVNSLSYSEKLDDSAVAASKKNINDFACTPSALHPRPVVLLHGTAGNQSDWSVLAPELANDGYCVFTLNYGKSNFSMVGRIENIYGTDDIENSSAQVAHFIDRILSSTKTTQTDIIGHSQGALVARHYMRFNGGTNAVDPSKNKVHTLVSLGGTNHGTTLDGISNILPHNAAFTDISSKILSVAALQQISGSLFMQKLNEDGDTDPGVQYTIVATKNDRVSTPPSKTFLTAGPGAIVHNIFVQDVNPESKVGHKELSKDFDVVKIVEESLKKD